MKTLHICLCFVALASSTVALSQLKLTEFGDRTITFDEGIGFDNGIADDDVMKGAVRLDTLRITEHGHWDYSPWNPGQAVFSSHAWAYRWQGVDHRFGNLNDPNRDDERIETWQTEGVDIDSLLGTSGYGRGITFTPLSWDDKSLTLRILNATGITARYWTFSTDTWFRDVDGQVSTMSLMVSRDHVDYTTLASRSSTALNNSLWSPKEVLQGQARMDIPSGSFIYLRINYDQNSNGDQFVFDNLRVTSEPVPEPATIAGLGMGLAWLAHRKRRGSSRK